MNFRITFNKLVKIYMYTCSKCNKVFGQKGHYDKHNARLTPCVKNTIVAAFGVEKPFLKWVGGKTQIIDTVIGLFPKVMTNYHEPFLGGGSVLLALLSAVKAGTIKVNGLVYASDLNSNLIGLYKNVQSKVETLIDAVKKLTDEFSAINGSIVNRKPTNFAEAQTSQESYYFWIRGRFNALTKKERGSVQGSAMFLFMNKTCFRGLYREGPNGFNVPFGNYKNPSIIDREHLLAVSTLIKDVVFIEQGFSESLDKVSSGDFVYLDPPYAPVDAGSFVSYTADGFGLESHKALFKLIDGLREKNVSMVLSNAHVPMVIEAFPTPKYSVKVISCRRAINSLEPGSKTEEVLVSNAIDTNSGLVA
jgi:DNA adenine methylase